ncbi:FHA domain-containing protein [Pseudomonadota bacterium]
MNQVELTKDRLIIGRSHDCDIVLDNAGVSSHHAMIEKDGGLFILIDSDSSNGVFVNGNKIDKQTLQYRDEIQIYNYVLRFMPTSGLQGDLDPDVAQDEEQSQAGTMEVNMSDVQDLLKLREKKKTAYIELLGNIDNQSRFFFEDQNLKIGKSKECDIRTSGFLFFGVAAEIQRKPDGYYIVPQQRGRVMRNGKPLAKTDKLMDGDSLHVRNLSMQFFHRMVNQ